MVLLKKREFHFSLFCIYTQTLSTHQISMAFRNEKNEIWFMFPLPLNPKVFQHSALFKRSPWHCTIDIDCVLDAQSRNPSWLINPDLHWTSGATHAKVWHWCLLVNFPVTVQNRAYSELWNLVDFFADFYLPFLHAKTAFIHSNILPIFALKIMANRVRQTLFHLQTVYWSIERFFSFVKK